MLSTLRVEIDLNLFPLRQHPSATLRQERAGELGKNDFLSAYGLSSYTRIPPMRRPLQRQLQTPAFLLLGPISVHGIRATDLSGKPTRHRSMLTFRWHKALSHGHSQSCGTEHFGQREPGARLAHLRRLRSNLDRHRTAALHRRQFCHRSAEHRICTGFDSTSWIAVIWISNGSTKSVWPPDSSLYEPRV